MGPPRTPGMNCPTPKAFRPSMPGELGKRSSFFTLLSAHYSFAGIGLATRGRPELTALPPGTHPAATLHNTLRTGGAPVLFALDTPAQDLETALKYGCHRSALLAADYATIQLIGRWRSDQILQYLHVSARPIMQCHTRIMSENSDYGQFPAPTIGLLD